MQTTTNPGLDPQKLAREQKLLPIMLKAANDGQAAKDKYKKDRQGFYDRLQVLREVCAKRPPVECAEEFKELIEKDNVQYCKAKKWVETTRITADAAIELRKKKERCHDRAKELLAATAKYRDAADAAIRDLERVATDIVKLADGQEAQEWYLYEVLCGGIDGGTLPDCDAVCPPPDNAGARVEDECPALTGLEPINGLPLWDEDKYNKRVDQLTTAVQTTLNDLEDASVAETEARTARDKAKKDFEDIQKKFRARILQTLDGKTCDNIRCDEQAERRESQRQNQTAVTATAPDTTAL